MYIYNYIYIYITMYIYIYTYRDIYTNNDHIQSHVIIIPTTMSFSSSIAHRKAPLQFFESWFVNPVNLSIYLPETSWNPNDHRLIDQTSLDPPGLPWAPGLSEQVTKRALTEEVSPILMAMVEPPLSGDIYPKGMVQTLRIGQTND